MAAAPSKPLAKPSTTPTNIINLTTDIAAPASTVFHTITSLQSYNDWLTPSNAFKGTTQISDDPIKRGTTYIETEPSGTRYGEVLELVDGGGDDDGDERKVVFHQPMRLRPEFLGLVVDVVVRITVTGREGGSRLAREVRLDVPLLLRPVKGWVAGLFRAESERAMEALQVYLEG